MLKVYELYCGVIRVILIKEYYKIKDYILYLLRIYFLFKSKYYKIFYYEIKNRLDYIVWLIYMLWVNLERN